MISYIDIAFLVLTAVMVFVGVKKGLFVSLLSMVRFIVIIPLSYFAIDYVEPYLPSEWFADISSELKTVLLFVICFVILLILTRLLLLIFKKLQKKKGMPLRHTNALLGGVFGFVKAVIIVFAISTVLAYLIDILPQTNQFYLPISSSYAVKAVENINPFNI